MVLVDLDIQSAMFFDFDFSAFSGSADPKQKPLLRHVIVKDLNKADSAFPCFIKCLASSKQNKTDGSLQS